MKLDKIGETYHKFRIPRPGAEAEMQKSLASRGQLTPVVVFSCQDGYQLIDGFKRLHAARRIPGFGQLRVRILNLNERGAKSMIYCLNRNFRGLSDLEEAWIVQALYREDHLSQPEIAELLDHHKSWVSRRLALVEKLSPRVQEDIRLGMLTAASARELVRLPRGNQEELNDTVRRQGLTSRETAQLVDLFEKTTGREQQLYLLEHPREALAARKGKTPAPYDDRLSREANRLKDRIESFRRLGVGLTDYLCCRYREELTANDRLILHDYLLSLNRGLQSLTGKVEEILTPVRKEGEENEKVHLAGRPGEPGGDAPPGRMVQEETCPGVPGGPQYHPEYLAGN